MISRIKQKITKLLILILLLTSSTPAYARIIFVDDVFENDSETYQIGTDDDATATTLALEFGGTNSEYISWDTSQFNLSDDVNITGGISANGVIDFSSASRLALDQGASNPGTCTEGDIFYNTTDNITYVCTATDTFTGLSSGNPDFEGVYGTDADNTLTASSTFDIDATGAVGIDSDAGLTLGGTTIGITADGGALAITGDGTNDIDISNAGAAIDMDSASFALDTTAGISLDGAAASNFTTSSGALTLDGSGGVNVQGNGSEVDITTTNLLDLNSGIFTLDGSTVSIDGTDATNLTMTANAGVAKVLTIQATNAGAGTGDLDINVDDAITIDSASGGISIDAAAASNFTTSSGQLTLSGATGAVISGNSAEIDVNGSITIDGNNGVNIQGNGSEVDVTTTAALDLNSGAFTLDGSTVSIDGTDTMNVTMTANDAADKTLTVAASNAGAGDGLVAVSTDVWDITGAGVASGFTGITSTGTINFSGSGAFRVREDPDPASNAACATLGELIYDTTDGVLQHCTGTGGAGGATWENVGAGGSADFEDVYSNDSDNTLSTTNGDFTVDTGTGDFLVTSNDWSMDASGNLTANNITANGLLTGNAGATISGAATSINNNSNFATNINTGTSTGAVSVGGGSGTVAVDSTSWDISSAGVASGFTGFSTTGNTTLGSGGTAITKHISTTVANVTSSIIYKQTCGNYASVTVTGAAVGNTVIATPTAVAGGIETVSLSWNATVSSANTVLIRACNPEKLTDIDTADTQTWRFDIWQH